MTQPSWLRCWSSSPGGSSAIPAASARRWKTSSATLPTTPASCADLGRFVLVLGGSDGKSLFGPTQQKPAIAATPSAWLIVLIASHAAGGAKLGRRNTGLVPGPDVDSPPSE